MKKGDKVKFKFPKSCPDDFAQRIFTPGRVYVGTVIRENGDSLVVSTLRCTFSIDNKDLIKEVPKAIIKKDIIKTPTSSEFMLFCDTCFELAVRWRDGWASVISGQKFKKREYVILHAGHFVSRGSVATRYNAYNCHAITSGENFAMSRGDAKTWVAYRDFMAKKYGEDIFSLLEQDKGFTNKYNKSYWIEQSKLCFSYLCQFCGGRQELEHRIKSWPKAKKDRINRVKEFLKL